MLVSGFELNVHFVEVWQVVGVDYVEVESYGFVAVKASDVPLVGLTDADICLCNVCVLLLEGGNLPDSSCNFDFLRTINLDAC